MQRFVLSEAEKAEIEVILTKLVGVPIDSQDPSSLRRITAAACGLPTGLCEALLEFRSTESSGAFHLQGFQVQDSILGNTPQHWQETRGGGGRAMRETLYLALCASFL